MRERIFVDGKEKCLACSKRTRSSHRWPLSVCVVRSRRFPTKTRKYACSTAVSWRYSFCEFIKSQFINIINWKLYDELGCCGELWGAKWMQWTHNNIGCEIHCIFRVEICGFSSCLCLLGHTHVNDSLGLFRRVEIAIFPKHTQRK